MNNYTRNIVDLEDRAVKWWPENLKQGNAEASIIPKGSPALTVISNAYLNNWSEAEVIQISITYR
jgi:hypothetical protein